MTVTAVSGVAVPAVVTPSSMDELGSAMAAAEADGRAVCVAAGNEDEDGLHARVEFGRSQTQRELEWAAVHGAKRRGPKGAEVDKLRDDLAFNMCRIVDWRALASTAFERGVRLQIEMPPGIDDGHQIRLSGEGEAGPRGGTPGNLYVVAHVEPHPQLKREETERWSKVIRDAGIQPE